MPRRTSLSISQGKPYKVYMMAASNKFLRIYYAKVKAVLDTAEKH